MRILWNTSHLEFTVFDYYYFSELQALLEAKNEIRENKKPLTFELLKNFDILVLNYPEIPFSPAEINAVEEFVRSGGKLLVAAYYQNEDGVADICSDLCSSFGLSFHGSASTSEDGYLITASLTREAMNQFNIEPMRVYFPCSCLISINDDAVPLLVVEDQTVAAVAEYGNGRVIALGTAVFWDNFSINREDNRRFVEFLFS